MDRLANVLLPKLPTTSVDGSLWTPPSKYILLGAFDAQSLRQLERWRRLIEGDFGSRIETYVALIGSAWSAMDLTTCFPDSRRGHTLATDDSESNWASMLRPGFFAATVMGGEAKTALSDPQSEEDWDIFREAIEALLTEC